VVGVVPFVMVSAFPAKVRFTGISFSYNFAYAFFGGLTPMALTLMLKLSPMSPAYYVLALAGIGVLVGCWLRGEAGQQALLKQISAQ